MDIKYDDAMNQLKRIVRQGVNLPEPVFYEKFKNYLFFDNDICTSEDLINATKIIINKSFGAESISNVFSSSDLRCLGSLHMGENWVTKVMSLSMEMNDTGDYGGLIILDSKEQYVLFQKTPVDEGILGINSNISLESINDVIYENFVDCECCKKWLEEKTPYDTGLVQNIGREFLIKMLENYR